MYRDLGPEARRLALIREARRQRIRRVGDWVLGVAAVLGLLVGLAGGALALDARSELSDYVNGQEAQTDRALFVGCVTGNTDGRLGIRVTADVLGDLVERVNANARAAGAELPPEFDHAPSRLRRVTSRNQPRPCPVLYPEGYRIVVAERGQ